MYMLMGVRRGVVYVGWGEEADLSQMLGEMIVVAGLVVGKFINGRGSFVTL